MEKFFLKILIFCLFYLGEGVYAQNRFKIGLDPGYTYSIMKTNLSNQVDSKFSGRYGFGVNLAGEYMVWKTLFVTTGVSFVQKNYKYERTGSRSGWYTEYNNNFLVFPLLIGGYILNNPHQSQGVWIKVAGGMYTEYWLNMKREGQYPVFSELQTDGSFPYAKVSETYDFKKNENGLNRLGYGLQGQAQLGYSFKKFDVYGAYNYQHGLSDTNKINADKKQKSTIRSYMISVGASYKFD
ncbi:outer membrane beta-barrel protein [Elizabethkingia anophelis]|uniref:outer membrane beta-barrel protein n=1 Tax=Elizabethkingia anophelis TaxID=1117645 RepID=UPI001365A0F0|nr:outer membrane beta-barrel protein [Elizabethkingia anophelis]MCT3945969.1 outer membrane beta-barrel protein [Elizabethkingia anophelis]MCT3980995.1 outer membrane beta-barrel protein [Elizabethkingia anophelis]MCT3995547.1 outer membrane beta-barrel protein [Elizabethkingia anophelis]MCT3999202.1 outer membrane beta-barrel protein [Elizabethkingia anophelis]MCT4179210.1 outer membrane beta-barrel protein [Elizabethkingia anophelis]